MLHQYIRQQANELAAARSGGYYPPFAEPLIPRGGQPIPGPQPRDDTRTMGRALREEGKPSPPRRNDKPRDQPNVQPPGVARTVWSTSRWGEWATTGRWRGRSPR